MFSWFRLAYTVLGICIIYIWGYRLPRGKKKKAQSNDCAFPVSCVQASAHVREALHGLREVFNRLIGVAVLDPVAHAMLDVPLEHDLAAAVQGGFGGVDLREHVLTRDILVDHPVDGLHLADDLFESAVQIFRVHTLSHSMTSIPLRVLVFACHNTAARPLCQSAARSAAR